MGLMNKIDNFVDNKLCSTKVGAKTISFLREKNISQKFRKIIATIILKKECYIPTEEMHVSKKYFETHKDQIDNIKSFLADSESVETFENAIMFRISHNTKYLPKYYATSEQYFAKDIIKFTNNEVFIDCGAYTGDTVKLFLEKCNNNYSKVVCFEPDIDNFTHLQQLQIKNLFPICAGVWSENTKLYFNSGEKSSSKIVESCFSNSVICVKSIDETIECEDATFIKMDIEGAEYNALVGAKNTIMKNKPKLAICIYHSDEDYLRIPQYLHSLVPEYKFYVRHYFYEPKETVLYAVVL